MFPKWLDIVLSYEVGHGDQEKLVRIYPTKVDAKFEPDLSRGKGIKMLAKWGETCTGWRQKYGESEKIGTVHPTEGDPGLKRDLSLGRK